MRDAFRRLTGRKPDSLAEISLMQTARLPLPDSTGDKGKYVQFTVRRDNTGHWVLTNRTNTRRVTQGIDDTSVVIGKVLMTHHGQTAYYIHKLQLTFDESLMILRDLEDTLLSYDPARRAPEKGADHFSHAYSLLPKPYRASLEQVYAGRLAGRAPLLAPRPPRPTAKPAPRGPR